MGEKTVTRDKSVEEKNGGHCHGSSTRQETCNTGVACGGGINCQWGEWSKEEIACSKTCDGGIKRYTRTKRVEEKNGGICSGEHTKNVKCNTGINCFPG